MARRLLTSRQRAADQQSNSATQPTSSQPNMTRPPKDQPLEQLEQAVHPIGPPGRH
jgi:hypothetical protein